jgi:predicted nucleic acid-binding protein
MTTEAFSQLFVDTNILLYSTSPASPWHTLAIQTLEAAQQSATEIFVSTQVLREYLAASTRLNAQGSGQPLTDILANLQTFQTDFRVVEDDVRVFNVLVTLFQNFNFAGRQVYDGNIVATMQVYGITHLLTHNVADFTRFAGLITVIPLVTNTP